MNPYFYIFGTILFTVYGQIILKWRLSQIKFELPEGIIDKIFALFKISKQKSRLYYRLV